MKTKNNDTILLGHGSGGKLSHELIDKVFVKQFNNSILSVQTDSAILTVGQSELAFTTDSFVVDPIFFPGGNIGKLAVCGTVNDLAVSGASPLFISSAFIIEEGFSMDALVEISETMAVEAKKAGIEIVTGDTKVVNRGKCDKVFINTSGIGLLNKKHLDISTGENISIGDKIIVNGSIGDHGMAILSARNELNLKANIESDCACLNHLIKDALEVSDEIKFMRDATRGGIATVLSELVKGKNYGLEIFEELVFVNENVRGICEMLGFDPFYVANEGKIIMVVGKNDADKVLAQMKKNQFGKDAAIIGEIIDKHHGKGWINTEIGGKRIIDMLSGEQLPRIC